MFSKIIKNNSKVKISSISAFTILEILITLTIFIIISTVLIANLKFKTPKDALNQGLEQIITFYRQAQTSTFTGTKTGPTSPDYGLYLFLDSSQLIVFADLDYQKDYDAGEEDNANCLVCGVFALPTSIKISGLEFADGTGLDSLTIVFSATNTSQIYFNSVLAAQNASTSLKNTSTNEDDTIVIHKISGQISR